MMGDVFPLEAAPKAVAYLATLLYTGAVVTAWLSRDRTDQGPLAAVAARVARGAAVVGLLALLVRAVLHAAVVADGWPDLETIRLVMLESRWGQRWQWQAGAVVVALVLWPHRQSTPGLAGATVAALAWCAVTPLLGHGASSAWQHTLHATHLVVAGAWLGTVAIIALATMRVSPRHGLSSFIARFSPWALICGAVAAVSGVVLAITYAASFAALVETAYGRWLLVKLAAVAAVTACGFFNWRRTTGGHAPHVGLLRGEALAAVVVVLVTALLSETEHP